MRLYSVAWAGFFFSSLSGHEEYIGNYLVEIQGEVFQRQSRSVGYYGVSENIIVKCPKCHENRAHRSHRRGPLERLIGLIGFRAYRCRACERRFLHFGNLDDAELAPVAPSTRSAEAEIRSTRSAMGRACKRREILLYGLGLLLFVLFLGYLIRDHGPGPSSD